MPRPAASPAAAVTRGFARINPDRPIRLTEAA